MSKNQIIEPKSNNERLNLFSLNKETTENFSRLEKAIFDLDKKLTNEIEIIKKVISR